MIEASPDYKLELRGFDVKVSGYCAAKSDQWLTVDADLHKCNLQQKAKLFCAIIRIIRI